MERMLLEIALKSALVLAATALAAACLRGRTAAARHLVWAVGMSVLVALPLLQVGLPRWRLEILPAAPSGGAGAAAWGQPADGGLAGLFLGIWLVGAAVVVGTMMIGRVRVWRLARTSVPMDGDGWPALASSLRDLIRLPRRVAIRRSDRATMPMMWGVRRPVILLPASAGEWPEVLRRDVLLHELVHVKRNDYGVQILVRLACAIHWYNPLVWLAAGRVRLERERACDDHVLRAGADPCDYAASLLTMARSLGGGRGPAAAVAMAEPSRLGERLAALLDRRRPRGVVTRRAAVATAGAGALVAMALAMIVPERRAEARHVEARLAWVAAAEAEFVAADAPDPVPDPAVRTSIRSTPAPAPRAPDTEQPVRPDRRPSPTATVALYQAPVLEIVISEPCDPGETHDSRTRPEPAAERLVQIAARADEVKAH